MEKEKLQNIARQLGVGGLKRHVFLCLGPTCCSEETGQAAWEELKKQIRNCGISEGPNICYRTKVGCLRICTGGPNAVVYPEGTWYCGLTPDRIPRFVQDHLVENKPIEEWIFARNQLPEPDSSSPGI